MIDKESTLEIFFPEHGHNNEESAVHAEKNKKHFTRQALKVLELMHEGKELTGYSAMLLGIAHLPSAIRHARKKITIGDQSFQLEISEAWAKEDGRTKYKKWWISPEQKGRNILKLLSIEKTQNQK